MPAPTWAAALADILEQEVRPTWNPTPKQAAAIDAAGRAFETLYGGAAGGGKALALNTPIATPTGWTTMGRLRVGDAVFDQDGQPTEVTDATDVMVGHDCYRLTFDDGATIVADANHLWVTQTDRERQAEARSCPVWRAARRAKRQSRATGKRPDLSSANATRAESQDHPKRTVETVRTTQDVFETQMVRGTRTNHSTRVAGVLNLPEVALPVDPYVLGLWLGDGTTSDGSFTTADPETVAELEKAGYTVRKRPSSKYGYGVLGLKAQLRDLGVLGNKHIPDAYLRASDAQRLALLQGLMDTDGCADPDGRVEFCGTSETLTAQTWELALTMGVKATIRRGAATMNGVKVSDKWRVTWTADLPAFRLPRKLARLHSADQMRPRLRYIVKVERVPSVPVRCIAVDSPSRTFLAGRELVVTHNSHFISHYAADFARRHDGAHVGIVRKSLPMLKQTHLLTLRPLLHGEATHNASELTWTFPNGSIIRFISLSSKGDEQNYKSVEFDLLLFDEVTELPAEAYTYMLTRLRSAHGHRAHAIAASNPEGAGFRWVKERWVTPRNLPKPEAGTPWHPPLPSGEPGPSRVFVPATVHDNPHLLAANPDYVRQLEAMPDPRKRAALLYGDWSAMDQVPGALWDLASIERDRVPEAPDRLGRLVVAVDPAVSHGPDSDDTGIVAVASTGTVRDRQYYVLADQTCHAAPEDWSARAVRLWRDLDAGAIVYENNQGYDAIKSVITTTARELMKQGEIRTMPKVEQVHAASGKGKAVRAEPVAVLYSQGRVHHVGVMAELEEQLTTWTPESRDSPDRLDALVWGVTWLMEKGTGKAYAF